MNTMNNRMIILGTPIEVDRNEVKMEEAKQETEILKFDMKNLNNAHVIVKRYNGGVYFKRVSYVTDVKSYPTKECLYYSKEEADTKVAQLNMERQKCKYSVENAGKYFINLFSAQVDTWGTTKVTVRNEPLSIKDFEANKFNKTRYYKTVEEAISQAKAAIQSKADDSKHRAKREVEELPKRIEEVKQQSQKNLLQHEKEVSLFTDVVTKLTGVTSQTFKEYETQGDKIARVLYAKAETTTKDNRTITTADMP